MPVLPPPPSIKSTPYEKRPPLSGPIAPPFRNRILFIQPPLRLRIAQPEESRPLHSAPVMALVIVERLA
jgi:hypothetical protein